MGGSVGKAVGGIVNPIGTAIGMGTSSLLGGGGLHAPSIGGTQSPMDMLTTTGGAPLLMNVALGANVDDTLASFLGISKDEMNVIANGGGGTKLNPAEVEQVRNLRNQLVSVQNDTNLKNQAVQKLANDFPNIMAQKIPQYSALADDATKQMMDQALNDIGAKYAAGGQLSSGATAAAAAQAGAGLGMQKLQYGTGLALQDWTNQYNNASALQSFQQKMLGQGAQNGFNAVQNALSGNRQIQANQANLNFQADQANNQSNQAMWGALGGVAGTALGYGMFSNLGSSNKLNAPTNGGMGGASYYGFSGPATPGYQQNNANNSVAW